MVTSGVVANATSAATTKNIIVCVIRFIVVILSSVYRTNKMNDRGIDENGATNIGKLHVVSRASNAPSVALNV